MSIWKCKQLQANEFEKMGLKVCEFANEINIE